MKSFPSATAVVWNELSSTELLSSVSLPYHLVIQDRTSLLLIDIATLYLELLAMMADYLP